MLAQSACLNRPVEPPRIGPSHVAVKEEPHYEGFNLGSLPTRLSKIHAKPLPVRSNAQIRVPYPNLSQAGQNAFGRSPSDLNFPHGSTLHPVPSSSTVHIGGSISAPQPTFSSPIVTMEQQPRRCAAMRCTSVLSFGYPHLRCGTCRADNVPRRPELQMVLTPAQSGAREQRNSSIPPLPSRVRPTIVPTCQPSVPVPPLPSRRPVTPISQPPAPICKTEPDIDADLALQALLQPKPEDDADIDLDFTELSYPEEVELSYPDEDPMPAPPVPPLPTRVRPPPPTEDVKPPLPPVPPLPARIRRPLKANVAKPPPLPVRRPVKPVSAPSVYVPLPTRKRRKVSHDPAPAPAPSTSEPVPKNATKLASPPLMTTVPLLPAPSVSAPLANNGATRPVLPPLTTTVPPLPVRTKRPGQASASAPPKAPSSGFKTCSVASCTNLIGLQSSASRCISCIAEEWKAKRAEASSISSSNKAEKKKVVSWADKRAREEEHDEFDFGNTSQGMSASSSSETTPISSASSTTRIVGWDSDLTDNESDNDGSGNRKDGTRQPGPESPPTHKETPTPARTGLKIRIPARPAPARDVSVPSSYRIKREEIEKLPSLGSNLTPLRPPLATQATSSSAPVASTSTPISITLRLTRPPVIPKGSRKCSDPRCKRILGPEYRWKMCIICRANARSYQRKRQGLRGRDKHLDAEFELVKAKEEEDEAKLALAVATEVQPSAARKGLSAVQLGKQPARSVKVNIEPFEDDGTPQIRMKGARVCSLRDCPHIIPAVEEYLWRSCARCRLRSRESRLRSKGRYVPRDVSPEQYRHELSGPKAIAMKRPDRRCLSHDCGIFISPESKYPYCRQCRLQDWRLKGRILRNQALRKQEGGSDDNQADDNKDDSHSSASTSGDRLPKEPSFLIRIPAPRHRLLSAFNARPPAPYPEYKNLRALLDNFKSLAKSFFDAQTMHFAHQPPQAKPTLSIFIFDGEFSLAAPDYDVVKRKDTDGTVSTIQGEIQQYARLQFATKKWLTVFDQGLVTRFACWRDPIKVTIPTANGKEGTTQVRSYHRVMEGELEIAVFANRSHPFIPGERTVVRVRLVG